MEVKKYGEKRIAPSLEWMPAEVRFLMDGRIRRACVHPAATKILPPTPSCAIPFHQNHPMYNLLPKQSV